MTQNHSHSHQEVSAKTEDTPEWRAWFTHHGIDPDPIIWGTSVTALLDGRNRVVYARISEFTSGHFSPETVWHQLESAPSDFPGHAH